MKFRTEKTEENNYLVIEEREETKTGRLKKNSYKKTFFRMKPEETKDEAIERYKKLKEND